MRARHSVPAQEIARRLTAAADPKKRAWWERYLKGTIPFRGTPMAAIRGVVHDYWREGGLSELPVDQQLDIAIEQFACEHAEDKLAGILILAELLIDELQIEHVPRLAPRFRSSTTLRLETRSSKASQTYSSTFAPRTCKTPRGLARRASVGCSGNFRRLNLYVWSNFSPTMETRCRVKLLGAPAPSSPQHAASDTSCAGSTHCARSRLPVIAGR